MQFTLHIHGIGETAQEVVDDALKKAFKAANRDWYIADWLVDDMQLGPDGTVTGHLLFTISDQESIR